MPNIPIISSIASPSSAELGRLAAFKAGFKKMPTWKKWLTGFAIGSAIIGISAAILAATVFSGGAVGGIIASVAVGCNLAAGASSAITNGHTFVQALKAKNYKLAFFSALGALAGLLGSIGSIFHFTSVVNLAVQTDIGISAAAGTVTSCLGGTIVNSAAHKKQKSVHSDMSKPLLDSERSSPIMGSYRKSMGRLLESSHDLSTDATKNDKQKQLDTIKKPLSTQKLKESLNHIRASNSSLEQSDEHSNSMSTI
jgi:hypothetical protein